jgi:hypothetical protein
MSPINAWLESIAWGKVWVNCGKQREAWGKSGECMGENIPKK